MRANQKDFPRLLSGLAYLHAEQIIHRDISPSNILLPQDINGSDPIVITDFGTAWHPSISSSTEPVDQNALKLVLHAIVDLKHSSPTHHTQHLSISGQPVFFSPNVSAHHQPHYSKTLGTPTEKTWPEALKWKTNPFQWWKIFPSQSWEELLPNVEEDGKDLVSRLVVYESGNRLTADQALNHAFFVEKPNSHN
ncbi:hypothetical protein DID88_006332 [Monilinia fructigena]|uniref:EKC/KEOPS complex subunit BUD32 n=1 Tax=Monilinia fructigena TaxID=38457 RepID=A0A395J322_9HELO|nr:hypothetical protein DID88_006332 [Monilinia fructigena]